VTLSDVKATISASTPPAGLSQPLLALWHDAKGDWDAAHRVAQDVDDQDGAWVHAYLHRKEGDDSNAAYWYRRAGRPVCASTLETEWDQIVTTLLATRG
jgi:hypothetical protein